MAAVCALLTGAFLAAPAHGDPAIYPPRYGSNGVFGVNPQASDGWATAFILPGRYRVEQAPSMPPYESFPGYWERCSAFPCAGNYPGHVIETGFSPPQGGEFVDILPSDAAVRLANITLIFAG